MNFNQDKNLFDSNFIASIDTKPSILFYDMEMTGGNTNYDEILQFSIIDLHDGVLFNEYIKPTKCKSWKNTEAVHHITPKMVENCYNMNVHRHKIASIFKHADMIVGYGIENDLRFMEKDKIYMGKNTIVYDLQKSFTRIYSSNNDMPSLQSCANYYRCPSFGEYHNSLIDAYITLYCFLTIYGLNIPDWLKKNICHDYKYRL